MKINSKGHSQVQFYMNAEQIQMFERLYPRCRTRFLSLCIEKALNDKDFFTRVFFESAYELFQDKPLAPF